MTLVTTEYISGKETEMLGIVKGTTIQSVHIGKDIDEHHYPLKRSFYMLPGSGRHVKWNMEHGKAPKQKFASGLCHSLNNQHRIWK